MTAQQRTLDDLKRGVSVQVDKAGKIRLGLQPMMDLPSVQIIDKSVVAQLEGEPCSICGSQPALLIDAKEKATYWMCAECMFEKVLIKMELEAKLEAITCLECEKSMLECECEER